MYFVCQQLTAQKFKTFKISVTIENVDTMASCELNNKIALLSEVAWYCWHNVQQIVYAVNAEIVSNYV